MINKTKYPAEDRVINFEVPTPHLVSDFTLYDIVSPIGTDNKIREKAGKRRDIVQEYTYNESPNTAT